MKRARGPYSAVVFRRQIGEESWAERSEMNRGQVPPLAYKEIPGSKMLAPDIDKITGSSPN